MLLLPTKPLQSQFIRTDGKEVMVIKQFVPINVFISSLVVKKYSDQIVGHFGCLYVGCLFSSCIIHADLTSFSFCKT